MPVVGLLLATMSAALASEPVVWKLVTPENVAGMATTVLGKPQPGSDGLLFDGEHDGVFVPVNPIAGWTAFTIEILFSPSEGGGAEQRFFHLQDTKGARSMIELRLNGSGEWWLDTFLHGDDASRALIDPRKKHATGKWYWAALRYDQGTMTHFVNGEQECQGTVELRPMVDGRVSVGVRQNKVFWFKGAIREITFTPAALSASELQRSP